MNTKHITKYNTEHRTQNIDEMISQGQLFPFEELNEKHISTYPEVHNKVDGGFGYGTWEEERREKTAKKSKKSKKESENSQLEDASNDFIDDPHSDLMFSNDTLESMTNAKGGNNSDDTRDLKLETNIPTRATGNCGKVERGINGKEVQVQGQGQRVPFWVENPNVLFQPKYLYEIFPVETMSYNQKLNAVTRLIIILTIIGFLFVRNLRILCIGAVCILAIFLLQYTQNRNDTLKSKEGFDAQLENLGVDAPAQAVINAFATDDPSKVGTREFFDAPRVNNPYNNVLITDIVDNPNKLPAPPAYYPETEKEILDKTKEAIQKMNPTFPDMTDKLFASLDDHFEFEQSARQFYSNPATTVPNDQGAFAAFCYGEMISCKEGNMFACARDAPRHNLY